MRSNSGPTGHPHDGIPELLPTPDGHQQCSACERTIYSDPKLAVAAIVPYDSGIVLIKRGIEPAYGKWSFPSGYVNRGEVVERAIEREVLEETELDIEVGQLIGLYSAESNPVVLAVFESHVVSGVPTAADEALDIGVFYPNDLPELAFEHDQRIVQDWQALQRV